MKKLLLGITVITIIFFSAFKSAGNLFPELTGKTLDNKNVTIPKDTKGKFWCDTKHFFHIPVGDLLAYIFQINILGNHTVVLLQSVSLGKQRIQYLVSHHYINLCDHYLYAGHPGIFNRKTYLSSGYQIQTIEIWHIIRCFYTYFIFYVPNEDNTILIL